MSPRLLRLSAPAVALTTLALAACGSSSSSSETTPAPNTTPWRTQPPVQDKGSASTLPLEGGAVAYTVKSGDYANGIAAKAGGGCSGADILDFNPDIEMLIPGQVLKVPANCLGAGMTEELLNADEPADTAAGGTDGGSQKTTTTVPGYAIYKVEAGDYWFGIVKKVGCSYKELRAANPGKKNLYPGMKLKVPLQCASADISDTTVKKKKG